MASLARCGFVSLNKRRGAFVGARKYNRTLDIRTIDDIKIGKHVHRLSKKAFRGIDEGCCMCIFSKNLKAGSLNLIFRTPQEVMLWVPRFEEMIVTCTRILSRQSSVIF